MLVVIGQLRFPAEARVGALAAMAEVTAATLAEPGCRFYAFAEDLAEPNLFRVSEGWDNPAALRAHFDSPHMNRFRTVREALGMSDRVVTIYETEGPTEV